MKTTISKPENFKNYKQLKTMKTKINFCKLVFAFLMFASTVFSQPIIGVDPAGPGLIIRLNQAPYNRYMTISRVTGEVKIFNSLRFENTINPYIGVIYKGTNRFMHNYGIGNTFLGVNSGNFTMYGDASYNTGVGLSTLENNTTGYLNTAIGYGALQYNQDGSDNTAVGVASLNTNISGLENTAMGYGSLQLNTSGSYNTAIGTGSLYNNDGSNNTALGYHSLLSNISGYSNTAVGNQSQNDNISGYDNSSLGFRSLARITTGYSNTAMGYYSLAYNSSGNGNTAIGNNAGTGITSGSNNIVIGNDAQVQDGTADDQVQIGGYRTTHAGVTVSWEYTSDRRLKSNISNTNLGLNFISRLRPVSYTRNNDKEQKTEYGFIAQEIEELLKESGVDKSGIIAVGDDGMYSVRYNDFLAPMVKAIQELKTENGDLKKEIVELKTVNEKVAKFEKIVNEMSSIKHTSLNTDKMNFTTSK